MEEVIIFGTKFWGLGLGFFAFFILTFFLILFAFVLINTKMYARKIDKQNLERQKNGQTMILTPTLSKNSMIVTFVVFLGFTIFLGRYFFYIHKVVVDENNVWVLKNAWNINLEKFEASEVKNITGQTRISTKGYKFTHALIETNSKTFKTLSGNPKQISEAITKLSNIKK